ncbi:hypothetical protein AAEO56_17640 [Flavobacterium sp. DGU11]|uniref:Histidine kinase N-terminal 7TM region domain-containing protein n=1 Tax=Flavobacterium arundinis TaxID=3139143 RepID=A0ABU9I1K2_9FLAO
MTTLQTFFYNLLSFTEALSAIIGVAYYSKLKNTYWKWFVAYLIFIAAAELFSKYGLRFFPEMRKVYYDFLIIPIQFFFFYWLYAYKSLKRAHLFWSLCAVYLLTFSLTHFFDIDKTRIINMITYSVGTLQLLVLVILEFFKQIKSDTILKFFNVKMFYVNFGVALFYIGTLPFFAFDGFAVEHTKEIWNNYWTVFLVLNNVLYLIFTASFIWGKPHL